MNLDLDLELLIKGGEIHKRVQEYARTETKSNTSLWDLAENIEKKIKQYTYYDTGVPLKGGVAFPTGLSLNNCAAHWSPNPGDKHFLGKNDIIKVDFGVHLQGHILDGAFSYTENPELQLLIDCSVDATNTGIDSAGDDAILGEIGADIQEVIEGYEVEINGKIYPVKSTYDLCGHQIGLYAIHCGKAVPNVKINYPVRMKNNEEYAIETFPTTGSGTRTTSDTLNTSHYMMDKLYDVNRVHKDYRYVLTDLHNRFGTLAFCKRWLKYDFNEITAFNGLIKKGIVKEYPPLYDTPGSYVAQTEKSIFITNDGKKIVLN